MTATRPEPVEGGIPAGALPRTSWCGGGLAPLHDEGSFRRLTASILVQQDAVGREHTLGPTPIRQPPECQDRAAGADESVVDAPASSAVRSETAAHLSRGLLAFPHLGDWTQDGQPSSQRQATMASRVALSQACATAIAALGEARTAGVAVVHEDRQPSGVLVQRGRDAADVPAVAGGEQRQQPDRGVLGRVHGTRHGGGRDAGLGDPLVGQRPPDRLRPQVTGREVERLLAEHLPGDDPAFQVADRLRGHLDRAEGDLPLAPRRGQLRLDDLDLRPHPRARRVVRVGLVHEREPLARRRSARPGRSHRSARRRPRCARSRRPPRCRRCRPAVRCSPRRPGPGCLRST